MSFILDFWNAYQNSAVLLREKDEAIKEAAEWQARHIETRRSLESAHKQLAEKQSVIDAAAEANVVLEARLAALDPAYDVVQEQRWRQWNARVVAQVQAEADLLGKRILALEAWVRTNGGDRDVIYRGAGLPGIADIPTPAPDPEEAA